LARLAWRDAERALFLAELADDDAETAREWTDSARTSARVAEFYALAAMLRKDGTPRQ
jgi:hypothetical protein